MNKFSKKSNDRLITCDHDLQELFHHVLAVQDCSILAGHRTKEEQNKLFHEVPKKTQLKYPNSKHNIFPSRAVDVAPYPIDWEDRERFYYFAGIVKGVAHGLGIDIRWGGDWDSDGDFKDQTFDDLVHFELRG